MINRDKFIGRNVHNPLVSILIPLYNAEKFVIEALESCVNQTYKNIEVIVVDDGSKDNSYALALEYSKNYPQIKVYRQSNSGACKARNYAFKQSKGDYIMYLDADDLMTENKISSQVDVMNNLNDPYAVITCAFEEFECEVPSHWDKKFHYHDYSPATDLLIDLWSEGVMMPVTCYLVTREMVTVVGDWDERLKKNQDGDYFSRVLMKASRVCFVEDACFFYRRGHTSLSTTAKYSEPKLRSVLLSYKKQKSILSIVDTPKVRRALARNFSLVLNSGEYGSDLCREALREINDLGQKPQIIKPSPLVHLFSSLFGVEFYLRIKSYIK